MQPPGPFPWDGQQLAIGFHLVYFPGEFIVAVDEQGAALGVVDQSLFSLAKPPDQRDDVSAGQMQLGDRSRVGDGVAVDSQVAKGFAHALLLDEGRQHLFVAVDDVLDAGSWWNDWQVV